MNTVGNETLDRIQQEIKESLEREEELRNKYNNNNNNNCKNNNNINQVNGLVNNGNDESISCNGFNKNQTKPPINIKKLNPSTTTNGEISQNNFRRFTQNPSTKGVMQKFLRMRGKLSLPLINTNSNSNQSLPSAPIPQRIWTNEDIYEPAKITIEPGKAIRNGFVPADVKMRKELQEFQLREEELRKERRKSQPDLMAALEAEAEIESNLKSAKTMALLYSSDDLTDENYSSGASSLKPARSLAELCDASDEDLATPGTHSLIKQFENLNHSQART